MTITVEYRADLINKKAGIDIAGVFLKPGDNEVTPAQLEILESVPYFNNGAENKVFVYSKPAQSEPKKTVKESTKTTKEPVKTNPLDSISVDDDAP